MKNSFSKKALLGISLPLTSLLLTPSGAQATNGFLSHCAGLNCGTGGAGLAHALDASQGLQNPALMVALEKQFFLAVGLFHPHREMNAQGPAGNSTAGNQTSKQENFPEGSAGMVVPFAKNWAFGVSLAGTGGMATKYDKSRANLGALANTYDKQILYRLVHMAPTVSWKINDKWAAGAAFVLGYSDIKTDSATNPTFAQTKGKLQRDTAYGAGGRFGVTWKAHPLVTLGLAYATPVWFQTFGLYTDFFLASLNTPSTLALGSTWHVTPNFDILFDIKEIFFKAVKTYGKMPADGGFGWKNQTVFMLGGEYRYTDWAFRLGYNYGKSPIEPDRTFANVLAPAIVEHHLTAGVGYAINKEFELTLSGFYAFNKSQTDPGTGDTFSQNGKGTKISMYQYGIQMGLKYKF